jgi:hypothetical protein
MENGRLQRTVQALGQTKSEFVWLGQGPDWLGRGDRSRRLSEPGGRGFEAQKEIGWLPVSATREALLKLAMN